MHFQQYNHLTDALRLSFLTALRDSEWRGAHFLHELLRRDALTEYCGENPQLILLMREDKILSFCVLCAQDEIHDTMLSPWIGFVYTFPKYRGSRYSQLVVDHACALAKAQNVSRIYISSDEHGLYEKYGFRHLDPMRNVRGEMTQVFFRDL